MKISVNRAIVSVISLILASLPQFLAAQVRVQCPGDLDGDAVIDTPDPNHPSAKCMHITAGDGYARMADGRPLYIFGFSDVTGMMPEHVMHAGMLGANFTAPTIVVNEGDEFYLTLTNVGMTMRPDLFDPHSVHWHGFPQAASFFDGVPESSAVINMGASFTYYYNVIEPGTYMYHCHVEATEHMQMGMLGNLFVRPRQDGTAKTYNGKTYTKFAYNDGDGSTGYDVDFALQLGSFDPDFHDADEQVQPLPMAFMRDKYPLINGRGYPDTVNPGPLPAMVENGNKVSQPVSALIEAVAGQRILLRVSNLNVTKFYTLASLGLPMQVVGEHARLLRGPSPDGGVTPGKDLYYTTNSINVGSGESFDVLLDTSAAAVGTYFLYTTNLNYLNNDSEDFGGMMTEVRLATN
jgi:FtsP/CotA-like multicopper oxidase with cupredoxin domain